MTKLSDTQRVLLSIASQREDGSVLPLTGTLATGGGRIDKSIGGLLTRCLLEERVTGTAESVHRTDGDTCFGLYLTAHGAAAIGASNKLSEHCEVATQPEPAPGPAKASTKSAMVIAMLQQSEGATLADLLAATGWLPHTTRAALTGLRKKGHTLAKDKRGEVTCYRILS